LAGQNGLVLNWAVSFSILPSTNDRIWSFDPFKNFVPLNKQLRPATRLFEMAIGVPVPRWLRARFAEKFAVKGATLRPDGDTNKELYGREATNPEILTVDLKSPAVARKFEHALNRGSPQHLQDTDQRTQAATTGRGIATFGHDDIAALAYELWQARGCLNGSPEEDWFHTAEELRSRTRQRFRKKRGENK